MLQYGLTSKILYAKRKKADTKDHMRILQKFIESVIKRWIYWYKSTEGGIQKGYGKYLLKKLFMDF